jgi:CheY-like chemotaxis protein
VTAEALANAAKHAGATRIDVRIVREPTTLVVVVADDGRGARGSRRLGATGLRRRVEALDGKLTIVSPSGSGTTLRAELPCGSLIAEDLALLRDGLTRLLRDNGFDVVDAVADGDALVHAARREQPDIAIVDIRLPPTFRDEGLRAALELRATMPELAILVVSQYVEHAYATELLAAGGGGVGYLLKDRIMNVDEFVDAVARGRGWDRTRRRGGRSTLLAAQGARAARAVDAA